MGMISAPLFTRGATPLSSSVQIRGMSSRPVSHETSERATRTGFRKALCSQSRRMCGCHRRGVEVRSVAYGAALDPTKADECYEMEYVSRAYVSDEHCILL